jgi:hypothetical protein
MKKILVLAACVLLLLPVSAMAGMTAFMGMDELSNSEMSDVTGQTGITIDVDLAVTGGYIAWGDDDGCTNGTVLGATGYLILSTVTMSNVHITGLEIDACSDGTTTYLDIYVPTLTLNQRVHAIRLAATADFGAGLSLGSLIIGSMTYSSTSVLIRAH